MRAFGSLLWREWREVRETALGCVGLVAAASFIVEHWVFKYGETEGAAEIFVPFAVLLFAVTVASDLFASDVKTKRMVPLALLPVPLRNVWAGKVTFLAVSIAAFYGFVVVLHAAILAVLGKEGMTSAYFVEVGESWIFILPVLGAAGAVVFYSTLGLRSFVSALLGLATAGGIMAGVAYLEIDRALELTGAIEKAALPGSLVALTVVFLAAGAVAFVRGHGRGRSRLRVAVLGVGCLLAVFAPASAATAVQVWRYHRLAPGDLEVAIDSFSLSVDGRYVALQVHKERELLSGQSHRGWGGTHRVWVVRVADGRLFDWSAAGETLVGWTEGGALWVSAKGEQKDGRLGRWVEPETGKTIRSARADEYTDELPPGPFNNAARWAQLKPVGFSFGSEVATHEIRMRRTDMTYEVESRGWPTLARENGHVIVCTDEGALHDVDVRTGEGRVLVENGVQRTASTWGLSPSGRYVFALLDTGYAAVDRETATIAARWSEGSWRYWVWAPALRDLVTVPVVDATDGISDLLRGCLDVQTGKEIRFESGLEIDHHPFAVQPLPDGGFVVKSSKRGIVVLDAAGNLVRTLYAAPAEDN